MKEPQIAYPAIQECTASLDSVDKPSGVLRVWFLLLEGLYSAAISANSDFQPFLLDLLYSGVEKLLDDPGEVYSLVLPLFVKNKICGGRNFGRFGIQRPLFEMPNTFNMWFLKLLSLRILGCR